MQDNKIITITLSVLLGIFLQVLLIFGDMQDSPNKAVLEFTKAYFKYDKAGMAERLCFRRSHQVVLASRRACFEPFGTGNLGSEASPGGLRHRR